MWVGPTYQYCWVSIWLGIILESIVINKNIAFEWENTRTYSFWRLRKWLLGSDVTPSNRMGTFATLETHPNLSHNILFPEELDRQVEIEKHNAYG